MPRENGNKSLSVESIFTDLLEKRTTFLLGVIKQEIGTDLFITIGFNQRDQAESTINKFNISARITNESVTFNTYSAEIEKTKSKEVTFVKLRITDENAKAEFNKIFNKPKYDSKYTQEAAFDSLINNISAVKDKNKSSTFNKKPDLEFSSPNDKTKNLANSMKILLEKTGFDLSEEKINSRLAILKKERIENSQKSYIETSKPKSSENNGKESIQPILETPQGQEIQNQSSINKQKENIKNKFNPLQKFNKDNPSAILDRTCEEGVEERVEEGVKNRKKFISIIIEVENKNATSFLTALNEDRDKNEEKSKARFDYSFSADKVEKNSSTTVFTLYSDDETAINHLKTSFNVKTLVEEATKTKFGAISEIKEDGSISVCMGFKTEKDAAAAKTQLNKALKNQFGNDRYKIVDGITPGDKNRNIPTTLTLTSQDQDVVDELKEKFSPKLFTEQSVFEDLLRNTDEITFGKDGKSFHFNNDKSNELNAQKVKQCLELLPLPSDSTLLSKENLSKFMDKKGKVRDPSLQSNTFPNLIINHFSNLEEKYKEVTLKSGKAQAAKIGYITSELNTALEDAYKKYKSENKNHNQTPKEFFDEHKEKIEKVFEEKLTNKRKPMDFSLKNIVKTIKRNKSQGRKEIVKDLKKLINPPKQKDKGSSRSM